MSLNCLLKLHYNGISICWEQPCNCTHINCPLKKGLINIYLSAIKLSGILFCQHICVQVICSVLLPLYHHIPSCLSIFSFLLLYYVDLCILYTVNAFYVCASALHVLLVYSSREQLDLILSIYLVCLVFRDSWMFYS